MKTSLEQLYKESSTQLFPKLATDLALCGYIGQVNLDHDENSYIIYAHQHGVDTDGLTVDDLRQLASMYSAQIDCAIFSKMVHVVESLLEWWKSRIDTDITLTIPETTYSSVQTIFGNGDMLAGKLSDSEFTLGLIENIRQNFISCINGPAYYPGIDSRIPLSKDEAIRLFDFLLAFTQKNIISEGKITAKTYVDWKSNLLLVVTTIIRLFVLPPYTMRPQFGTGTFDLYDDPEEIYKRMLSRQLSYISPKDLQLIYKSRRLKQSHVLMMGLNWDDALIISDRTKSSGTPSSRMLATMIISRHISEANHAK